MKYRADVDGLRAIAVLAVVFYHAHLGFPGGFIGVDVFFVLSGYLITGLLLKSVRNDQFSFVGFWERRVRRLVPALAVTTAVTALGSYFLLLPEDLVDLGGALIAQPLMLANVYFWWVVKGGYFGDRPEIRPLLHTWSLGVEEQFYVFFPLLLFALARWRIGHLSARILLAVLVSSFAVCVWLTEAYRMAAFFNLPSRAWELLMGGMLNFLPLPRRFGPALSAAVIGLGMIGFGLFNYSENTVFPGVAAFWPCLGTALLLWGNSGPDQPVRRILSLKPIVHVGQISYSYYLWHWPLMAWSGYYGWSSSEAWRWILVCLTGLLGHASWRWIETPIRERRLLVSRGALLALLLTYTAGSILVGAWFRHRQGFPQNWKTDLVMDDRKAARRFELETDPLAPEPRSLHLGAGDAEESFLLWGDSHAMSLGAAFDQLGKDLGIGGVQFTRSSTPPVKHCAAHPKVYKAWSDWVMARVAQGEIRAVFLAGFWSGYVNSPDFAGDPNFSENLGQTVADLKRSSPHKDFKVYFVRDVPNYFVDPSRQLLLAERWPQLFSDDALHRFPYDLSNSAVEAILREQNPPLDTLSPAPLLLKLPRPVVEGRMLYFDSHHLTDFGALQLRPAFEPALQKLR